MSIVSTIWGRRTALLLVPALLAVIPAGCINELAERGGPRSRYDETTPSTFPTITAVRASKEKLLTPAEQARMEAQLRAKAAAAQRGAGRPLTAKEETASGRALKATGASHGKDTLTAIEKNCRNPQVGQATKNCPQ